jgi:hypothetical protein
MNVRIVSLRVAGGSGRRSTGAAVTLPLRTKQSSATPIAAHSAPGMMNAARQEITCASEPDAPRDPIPAERTPAICGIADQPGGADRMIDRAEQTDRRETERQRDRAARQAGSNRSATGADKKYDHHALGAPSAAEPARRQRAEPEQHKAAER